MLFGVYKDALKTAIDKIDVAGSLINHLQGLQQVDYNYMAFCLSNHIADMHDVRELLHKRLLVIGRENYRWLMTRGSYHKYPDRAPSAVALAYAIEHHELSETEIARITFGHDDTADTFLLDERKKFLDDIIQQITNGMNNQKGSP